jgi:hypothetical protein
MHLLKVEAPRVADSRVLQATGGLPEIPPDEESKPSNQTLGTIARNSVVLDLGQGRYATRWSFPGNREQANELNRYAVFRTSRFVRIARVQYRVCQ